MRSRWLTGSLRVTSFLLGAAKRGNTTGLETCTGTGNAKPLVVYDTSV